MTDNIIEFPISYNMRDKLIQREMNFAEKLDNADNEFTILDKMIRDTGNMDLFAQFKKCVEAVQHLITFTQEEYH